jgi:hypothetical protein
LCDLSIWKSSRQAELVENFEVARGLDRVPHPYSDADAENFILGAASKEESYGVELEGVLIGCVNLVVKDYEEEVKLSRTDPSEDWDVHMNKFFEDNPASIIQEGDNQSWP